MNNVTGLAQRHNSDIVGDMLFAIVIWSCILLLTVMNVLAAFMEIRRYRNSVTELYRTRTFWQYTKMNLWLNYFVLHYFHLMKF